MYICIKGFREALKFDKFEALNWGKYKQKFVYSDNPWIKYLWQNKEIKHNWAGPEHFVCFSIIFDR